MNTRLLTLALAVASGSKADETVTAVAAGLALLVAVLFGVRIGVRRRGGTRPTRAGASPRRPLLLPAVHRRRWIPGLAVLFGLAVAGPVILLEGPAGSGVSQQREPAANPYLDTAAPAAAEPAGGLAHDLAGSPAPLAELHGQAGELLGTDAAFKARLRALRGYPIVVNAWASWCTPCRSEFNLFAAASAQYGRHVAFLGADTDDSAGDARSFLTQHPVSYPSYQTSESSLSTLAVLEGLPTTIYIDPAGNVVQVHVGQYGSQGTLDQDMRSYTLAR